MPSLVSKHTLHVGFFSNLHAHPAYKYIRQEKQHVHQCFYQHASVELRCDSPQKQLEGQGRNQVQRSLGGTVILLLAEPMFVLVCLVCTLPGF